jgi:hypothetical protein
MRADMAKVIVERPRKKGCAWKKPKGYKKLLHRYGEDGPPCREGMKRPWKSNTKYLNEHLGPLRRYLDSQVGLPWDMVHSEICTHINRNSAVQDHVRDHVDDYVAVHVVLIDGVPCSGEGNWNYGQPLRKMGWKRWYVCPVSGLLQRVTSGERKRPHHPKKDTPPRYIRVSSALQCRFLDDAWHLVVLKPLPRMAAARRRCRDTDILLNCPVADITPERARRHYGDAVYAVAKRPLARRELSQYPIPSRWWK